MIESWDDLIWGASAMSLLETINGEPALINMPDSFGEYAIQCAAFNHKADLVEALLKLGADPNQLDDQGQLPLHSAMTYYEDNPAESLSIVKLLLSYGADIEKRGYPDFTALHRACLSNALDVVQVLLNVGAEINARSEDRGDGGRTPLDVAEMHKHHQIAAYIRQRGGKNA